MPARPLLAALLLAPSLAAALPWDGTYLLSEEATCDGTGEQGTLRIAEGVLHGLESACRMTQPVDVLDLDATLFVLECEGEGQEWTERAMLMKAAEGDAIFIAWRGFVFRYDRCPEAPAEEAVAEDEPAGDAADGDPDQAETEDAEPPLPEDAPADEPSE